MGPGLINTNLVPGPVNTNWGPGPVNANLGPGVKQRAWGREIQILMWLSAVSTRFSWKKYLLPRKSRSSHRRCSEKEVCNGQHRCFPNICEKHLWTAASENKDFSDKFTEGRYFLNFIILLIKVFAFSILNFALTECFFLSNIFIIKKYTSSEMLSFLYRWDYYWKCEFDTDVKIE